jgi:hypothetical protein
MSDNPQQPNDSRLYRPTQADTVLQTQPQRVTWRLNMRADPDDHGMCLPEDFDNRYGGKASQRRLISYIAAGGMRDLHPSHTAEADEHNRDLVIFFAMTLLVLWMLFFFLPCH